MSYYYKEKTFSLQMILSTSMTAGAWLNMKMPSYQYRKSHCGDKTILRPSYLHNGISYTDKMTSLYWIRPWWSRDHFNIKMSFTSIGNLIVEITRSYDSLISTMGFPILIRWHLYIESGPWWSRDHFNIKMSSDSITNYKEKAVPRVSHLYNGNTYT